MHLDFRDLAALNDIQLLGIVIHSLQSHSLFQIPLEYYQTVEWHCFSTVRFNS